MVHNPSILILDEPTVGLDPLAIKEVRKLILELKEEHTILLSSHLLHEVELLCSHVTFINKGKIYQSAPLEKTQSSEAFIVCELEHWSSQFKEELEKLNLKIMKIKNNPKSTVLFFKKEAEDMRPILGKFAIERNLGLLSLKEEVPDLELIFDQLMTENQDVRV